jgi:hypothetical protein
MSLSYIHARSDNDAPTVSPPRITRVIFFTIAEPAKDAKASQRPRTVDDELEEGVRQVSVQASLCNR